MRTVHPKYGYFFKSFKIKLCFCFITQLLKKLQQWPLYRVSNSVFSEGGGYSSYLVDWPPEGGEDIHCTVSPPVSPSIGNPVIWGYRGYTAVRFEYKTASKRCLVTELWANRFCVFFEKIKIRIFFKKAQNVFAFISATKYRSDTVLYSKWTAGHPLSPYNKHKTSSSSCGRVFGNKKYFWFF